VYASDIAALSKVGLLVPARGRRVANPPQATSLPHKEAAHDFHPLPLCARRTFETGLVASDAHERKRKVPIQKRGAVLRDRPL